MHKVILKPGRDWSIRHHHPWIFSGAIGKIADDTSATGATVAVVSAEGDVLGYGWYSPASQIRVRMISFVPDIVPGTEQIAASVAAAVGRRAEFFVDGFTDGVRIINAENDMLPGVVADFYCGHIVCQFTSAGAEVNADAIAEALMHHVPGALSVSVRDDVESRRKEGLPCREGLRRIAGVEPPQMVEIAEGPVRFRVDIWRGHKTGFYLDQREARARVGALSAAKDVLNCFSYTGGFGLYAAASGANRVTQVDISAEAMELAKQNAALSAAASGGQHAAFSAQTVFEYVVADVFKYLRECRDAGRTFDLIVLDPPKFAESKAQVMKAARGYKDINLLAMKLLRPGGILATFSCSGAMDAVLFDKILAEAAADAKKDFQIIGRTGQSADHPVALAFPEGHYLKGVILRSMK